MVTIDEINKKLISFIDESTSFIYELNDTRGNIVLGEIRGAIDFATSLQELIHNKESNGVTNEES